VWYGAAAPAGVPAEIAEAVRASFNRALEDVAFREALTKVGFYPQSPRSEVAIKEFVDADRARWSAIIKRLNITLD